MKASLVDNGFGNGRKCIELSAESDEERNLLERFRIGHGGPLQNAYLNEPAFPMFFRIRGIQDDPPQLLSLISAHRPNPLPEFL